MRGEEINEILRLHKMWLNNEEWGVRADLIGADLSDANISGADLSGADIRGANLRRADLSGANISGADLRRADLRRADLSGADLDFSCLPLCCGSLSAKFDKKHYIQFLYHTLKSLQQNDLIDEDFKKRFLTAENIALANKFHRVDECGKVEVKEDESGKD